MGSDESLEGTSGTRSKNRAVTVFVERTTAGVAEPMRAQPGVPSGDVDVGLGHPDALTSEATRGLGPHHG